MSKASINAVVVFLNKITDFLSGVSLFLRVFAALTK